MDILMFAYVGMPMVYAVLHACVRIVTERQDCIHAIVQYFSQLIEAGHSKTKLTIALTKFCGNYANFLWKYDIHTRQECIKQFIDPILLKIGAKT